MVRCKGRLLSISTRRSRMPASATPDTSSALPWSTVHSSCVAGTQHRHTASRSVHHAIASQCVQTKCFLHVELLHCGLGWQPQYPVVVVSGCSMCMCRRCLPRPNTESVPAAPGAGRAAARGIAAAARRVQRAACRARASSACSPPLGTCPAAPESLPLPLSLPDSDELSRRDLDRLLDLDRLPCLAFLLSFSCMSFRECSAR